MNLVGIKHHDAGVFDLVSLEHGGLLVEGDAG